VVHQENDLRDPLRPAALLHLTLLGLGAGDGLNERAVAAGLEIGAAIQRRAFEVVFEAAVSFGHGPRIPLVLVCTPGSTAAVTGLRDLLGSTGEELGFGRFSAALYVPHLTVSYGPTAIPEAVLDKPLIWRPRELVLVHSHQGAGRHVALGRWPLLA
jgi:2'-5' RNA ligase